MGHELMHVEERACGCKVEHYAHDFWCSDRYERSTYCPRHQIEQDRLAEERRRQEEERRRQEAERRRQEEEERRQKLEKRDSLIKELEKIASKTNSRVFLSKVVLESKCRHWLIKRRTNRGESLLALEHVKKRWKCNKEAALFYMRNRDHLQLAFL